MVHKLSRYTRALLRFDAGMECIRFSVVFAFIKPHVGEEIVAPDCFAMCRQIRRSKWEAHATGADLLNHVAKRLAVLGVSIHQQIAFVAQRSNKREDGRTDFTFLSECRAKNAASGIYWRLSTVRNRDRTGHGKDHRFSHLQLG
jgi:hypothetical protein